jgi:hypothetical protein
MNGKKRRGTGTRSRFKRSGAGRRFSRANGKRTVLHPQHGSEPAAEHRETAFQSGYELGMFDGGEKLLEDAVPTDVLLPEISLQQVISAGVGVILPNAYRLMDEHQVYEVMDRAIAEEHPCSVIRLGDGELLTLSQDLVYDAYTIAKEGRFLPYAGVEPPDLAARDQLAMAVRQSHIVGVPLSRRKYFQPLLYPALRGHGIEPASLRMTISTINYSLCQSGLLAKLLAGRRLLLIGNAAPELAQALTEQGFTVTSVISPVRGFPDIDQVMWEVRDAVFDLALVAAGIPAVVICWRIAMERGKTALDFGHLADKIVKGDVMVRP